MVSPFKVKTISQAGEKGHHFDRERFIQLGEEECTKISVEFTGKIEHVMIKNKRKVTSRDR